MSLLHPDSRFMRYSIYGFLLIGIALCFWKVPVGLGMIAGTVLAVIIYEWNVHYWNKVMDRRTAGRFTGLPHFLINFALMGGILLYAVNNPGILNIFSSAVGLTAVKSAIIISELFKRKEAV